MNPNKQDTIKKDDPSDSTQKNKPQQTKNEDTKYKQPSDRTNEEKKAEFNTDATQRNFGVSQPQSDRQRPSDTIDKSSVGTVHRAEDPMTDPSESTKKQTSNSNDKSARV